MGQEGRVHMGTNKKERDATDKYERDLDMGLYDRWLQEDGLTLMSCWRRDGLSYQQIADRIGITDRILKRWREEHPEINEALRVGKELLDYKVENALLKAALGYTTKEIKVTLGKKIISGETFTVLKETTTKEVGPNAVACLAWLNNRKHEQWKRNRDKVVEMNEEDSNVTVTIIRQGKKEDDGVNEGVTIERKPKKEGPRIVTDEEAKAGGGNPDYWPDDWIDETNS